MADQKVTALTAIGTLSDDDLFYVVDDPAGTPLSRKATGEVVQAYVLQGSTTVTTGLAINADVNSAIEWLIDNASVGASARVTVSLDAGATGFSMTCEAVNPNAIFETRDNVGLAYSAGGVLSFRTDDLTGGSHIKFGMPSSSHVMIGSLSSDPVRRLHVRLENATTNAVTYVQRLQVESSGTPAVGIGVGQEFVVETAADNLEVIATVEASVTDSTSTTEDADLQFKTMVDGSLAVAQWVNRVKRTSTDHSVATSVATEVTGLTFNAVQPGTYGFRYNLLNQSASTAAGLGFGLHFTGTASQFRAMRRYAGTTSLANGIAGNGTTSTITGQYQNTHACSAFASTTTNMMNTGVQAVNVDHMEVIEGMMTVTAAGNFHLFHASEVATTTRVSSNSIAFLERYA